MISSLDCLIDIRQKHGIDKMWVSFYNPSQFKDVKRHDYNHDRVGVDKIPLNDVEDAVWNTSKCAAVLSYAGDKDHHYMYYDFSCIPSIENMNKIKKMISKQDLTGHLVYSGNSYHFVGDQILYKKEWKDKMVESLYVGYDVIGSGYIGHRITSGYGTLRVNSNDKEKSFIPVVVDYIS